MRIGMRIGMPIETRAETCMQPCVGQLLSKRKPGNVYSRGSRRVIGVAEACH